MKLITELNNQAIEYVTEDVENGDKNLYIKGIFMQAEKPNKNGRLYPRSVMENQVSKYQEQIGERRSLGELGHPPSPTINLDKVSHLITELKMDGNDVVGKAKILKTPMGNIAKNFIDEGVRLGVSSRGVGSLKERNGVNEVQNDFLLSTVDIVSDPSAPNAFVQGMMENVEWILDSGIWQHQQIEEAQKIITKTSKKHLEEQKLKVFQKLLSCIK
tara:strand:- start:9095 stop:9742 length:648 start_codon:yes stop_codon:yes gene_type:complete